MIHLSFKLQEVPTFHLEGNPILNVLNEDQRFSGLGRGVVGNGFHSNVMHSRTQRKDSEEARSTGQERGKQEHRYPGMAADRAIHDGKMKELWPPVPSHASEFF